MKAIRFYAMAAAGLFMVSCASDQVVKDNAGMSKSSVDSASYAMGMTIGNMVKSMDFANVNLTQFEKGMRYVLGNDVQMEELRESGKIINDFRMKMIKVKGEQNRLAGEKFLSENKTKEGVVETASGLQYIIIEPGNEVKPTADDKVRVHYKGTLLDGKVFDSSYDRGEPIEFPLKNVIKGWTEGMQFIGEGGKIKLFIPSELAYGEMAPGEIGPNSTLVFEVELLKVIKEESKK